MPLHGKTGALLTSKDDFALQKKVRQIFKSHRSHKHGEIMFFCDRIDQMRCRYTARNTPLPSAVLDQVIQKERESLIWCDVSSVRINDSKTICVSICGHTEMA